MIISTQSNLLTYKKGLGKGRLSKPKEMVKLMSPVKIVDATGNACHDSVKEILYSALEAVQAKHGVVSLLSPENDGLQNYVCDESLPGQSSASPVVCWVATHGKSLILETGEETLLNQELTTNKNEAFPLICVPIQVGGKTIGAFKSNFSPATKHGELEQKYNALKLAADLMGYVIENAALRDELQQVKALAQTVNNISLEIQEAELERIILEMHDGVAQPLASAFQYLRTVGNIGELQEEQVKPLFLSAVGLVQQAIREIREIIDSITPVTLDLLGLVPTLQQELRHFRKETGCHTHFRSANWPSLPKQAEVAIYRIVHEAINNIRKHARAPRLELEMSQKQKRLLIRVKDWGIGFILQEEPSSSSHATGFFIMRRCADFLGGNLKINSCPGIGTEILLEIPWQAEEPRAEKGTDTGCG